MGHWLLQDEIINRRQDGTREILASNAEKSDAGARWFTLIHSREILWICFLHCGLPFERWRAIRCALFSRCSGSSSAWARSLPWWELDRAPTRRCRSRSQILVPTCFLSAPAL